MTVLTDTTLPTDEELRKLLRDASPQPWQLTRTTPHPDSPVNASWGLGSADGYEVVWRGMYEADAHLAVLAPDLALAYLAQAEALSDVRGLLRHYHDIAKGDAAIKGGRCALPCRGCDALAKLGALDG